MVDEREAEWRKAILRWTNDKDPKDLAALLRSSPMPPETQNDLAEMIDPVTPMWPVRIAVKWLPIETKKMETFFEKLSFGGDVARELLKQEGRAKLDAAVMAVEKDSNKGRSYLFDAFKHYLAFYGDPARAAAMSAADPEGLIQERDWIALRKSMVFEKIPKTKT